MQRRLLEIDKEERAAGQVGKSAQGTAKMEGQETKPKARRLRKAVISAGQSHPHQILKSEGSDGRRYFDDNPQQLGDQLGDRHAGGSVSH